MLYDLSDELRREQFMTRAASLYKKGGCIVELAEKKPQRTLPQNSYLHLILGFFGAETGDTLEYVKEKYFKYLCNESLFVREKADPYLGTVRYLRSSRDLTTEEMTIAIERFRNWASSEAGIYIPAPNEERLLQLMEMEVNRNKAFL